MWLVWNGVGFGINVLLVGYTTQDSIYSIGEIPSKNLKTYSLNISPPKPPRYLFTISISN